jgi:hypothetical protein
MFTSIVGSIGYVGRSISAKQSSNWSINPYIVQSLLLLLALAFFAVSIYMVFGRIIILTDGEDHSLIRVRWLIKVFVTYAIGNLTTIIMKLTTTVNDELILLIMYLNIAGFRNR